MLPQFSNLSFNISLIIIPIVLSLYVFNGIIIYRFIAIRLLKADNYLNETQLIFPSFILGILVNGILGQFLAICHLFSFWIFILIFIFCLYFLRQEALATLRYLISIPKRYCHLIKRGDILQAVFWCFFFYLVIINFFRIQIPCYIIDIYVSHIPIMESLINNGGFIYPVVISNKFYGSQPSFIELLFAQGLVLHSNYYMISALHYTVFVAFLVSLLSFAPKHRWIALLTLIFIFNVPDFYQFAVTAMSDTARACFAVLGLVFLATYFQKQVTYFMVFSGLLVGAALASKYIEFLVLFIAIIIWVFLLVTGRDNFKRMTLYLSLVFMVSGFWYMKNLIFLGNPIYPFVFGHPGLDDQSWAATMALCNVAYLPEHRHYSRAIFSITGWLDCIKATSEIFLPQMTPLTPWGGYLRAILANATLLSLLIVNTILKPKYKSLAILAGLSFLIGMILIPHFNPFITASFMIFTLMVSAFLGDNKTNLVTAATIAYFIGYYFLVFHCSRYGITGHLLLYTAFYLALMTLVENIERTSLFTHGKAKLKALGPHMYRASVFLLSAYLAVFLCQVLRLNLEGPLQPSTRELVRATFSKGGIEKLLSKVYPFYGLYNFVVQNKLRYVLNPLDPGAIDLTKYLIPGEKPDDTFLPSALMPPSLEALDAFLKEHNVEYFVKIDLRSNPMANEFLGAGHVAMVNRMFEKLLPRSTRVYSDKHGYELYKVIN